MLTLMRSAVVPNSEILLAKGLGDLQQIANKYGVALPGMLAPALATEAVSDGESEDSSSSSSVAFNGMRRWTRPPSYYETRSPTASSSSSRRARRWQVSVDSPDATAPEVASFNSSFGSRFGPPPTDADMLFGGGGGGGGSSRTAPVPTAW